MQRKTPHIERGAVRTIAVSVQKRTVQLYRWATIVLFLFVMGSTVIFQGVIAEPSSATSYQTQVEKSADLTYDTEVLAYVEERNSWQPKPLKEIDKGQEFLFDNRLCYVDQSSLIRMNPEVNPDLLPEADRIFDKNNWRFPEINKDVIRFVNRDNRHLRHDLMDKLQANDRFFFQGRLYEAIEKRENPTVVSIRDTGIVLSRVTHTFKRQTSKLSDLTVIDRLGKESVISGTPEHPFFVPAVGDYVAMEELRPNTILKTDDGSLATVKENKAHEGNFTVYDLSVEDTHNYYVSSASGGPSVNVHNNCLDRAGIRLTEHARNRITQRASRGVTPENVLDAYNNGRSFYNPETRTYIRHSSRTGISVAVDRLSGGEIITVFEGNPSPRWNPVRGRR